MKVIRTAFEGLLLFEPTVHCDDRGIFYESWRATKYKELGISDSFVQDDISLSYKNVLRGMHYQKGQGKLVSVIQGVILDVVVDIRPESSTYLKYFSIELSSEFPRQLYISSGFAHGFYVLSDVVIINYKCTQYYNKAVEGGIFWNDPTLGIKWPCSDPIISEKDSHLLPYGVSDAASRTILP